MAEPFHRVAISVSTIRGRAATVCGFRSIGRGRGGLAQGCRRLRSVAQGSFAEHGAPPILRASS